MLDFTFPNFGIFLEIFGFLMLIDYFQALTFTIRHFKKNTRRDLKGLKFMARSLTRGSIPTSKGPTLYLPVNKYRIGGILLIIVGLLCQLTLIDNL